MGFLTQWNQNHSASATVSYIVGEDDEAYESDEDDCTYNYEEEEELEVGTKKGKEQEETFFFGKTRYREARLIRDSPRSVMVASNNTNEECPFCLEQCGADRWAVQLPDCGHTMCFQCLAQYCALKLKEPRDHVLPQNLIMVEGLSQSRYKLDISVVPFGISCPFACCPFIIRDEDLDKCFGKTSIIYKAYALGVDALRWETSNLFCPACGCDAVYMVKPGIPPELLDAQSTMSLPPSFCCTRKECKYASKLSFCGKCRRQSHPGTACGKVIPLEEQEEIRRKCVEKTLELLAKLSGSSVVRCCPTCRTVIEKNLGCSHMFCTKCKTNFDWSVAPRFDPKRYKVDLCK